MREVVPGLYGYVSATKWVVDCEVTRFADFKAYWTQRGWRERGPIKTESRIDVPHNGETSTRARSTIAGVAWAQTRRHPSVEVRVDGGAWQKATLGTVPNADTWVQWRLEWAAEPGDHKIEARATNAKDAPQTGERADLLPDGATGYQKISVKVQ